MENGPLVQMDVFFTEVPRWCCYWPGCQPRRRDSLFLFLLFCGLVVVHCSLCTEFIVHWVETLAEKDNYPFMDGINHLGKSKTWCKSWSGFNPLQHFLRFYSLYFNSYFAASSSDTSALQVRRGFIAPLRFFSETLAVRLLFVSVSFSTRLFSLKERREGIGYHQPIPAKGSSQ